VKIVRADRSGIELECHEALKPNMPVRLTLTDGVVLGRVERVCSGGVTLAVDHVSPMVSGLENLAKALAMPSSAAHIAEAVPVRLRGRPASI
jgi:hypothetical protein